MEQQLLLKLLWIPSEPTRMNMLRMFLEGPGDQTEGKLSPVTFLEAIAYHAKLTKIIKNNIAGKNAIAQQEMDSLLQIAMNARSALVEMYGEESPVVHTFQNGLQPAFS
jgi:hypothetical protein